ncbi:MAG: hypothetical protein QM785_13850 [Pyrinomonadaceae bacterium]
MQSLDCNRKREYISRTMGEYNLSILSEQRVGPTGEPEIYIGELLRCHNYACSFETYDDNIKKCPMCGRNMLDSHDFRVLGGILIGLGVILTTMGGALLYFVTPKIPRNDDGRAAVSIVIFVAILGAGMLVLLAGLRQAMTGNKNQKLTTAMLAGFAVLLFLATISRYIF